VFIKCKKTKAADKDWFFPFCTHHRHCCKSP